MEPSCSIDDATTAILLRTRWFEFSNSSDTDNSLSPKFCCCWRDCEWVLAGSELDADGLGFETIRSHISLHLDEQMQDGRLIGALASCQINGCRTTVLDPECFRRHTMFHLYHIKLQWAAVLQYVDDIPESQTCAMDPMNAPTCLIYDGSPFVCQWFKCQMSFDDPESFTTHTNSHVKDIDLEERVNNKFICCWADCSCSYQRRSVLRAHMKHHSGEKDCACPFCGQFLSDKHTIIKHWKRRHTEGSELKCFYCHKIFATESLLRSHSRRHVKNYKCDFCEMTVDTPHELRTHIKRRHSQCKEFVCSVCGRGFSMLSDLRRHLTIHSENMAYSCERCEKKFRWPTSLKKHIESVHERQPPSYACHFCDKRYFQGKSLTKHLRMVHKMQADGGHTRFQYKMCADGLYRVQTERYESHQLTTASQFVEQETLNQQQQPLATVHIV